MRGRAAALALLLASGAAAPARAEEPPSPPPAPAGTTAPAAPERVPAPPPGLEAHGTATVRYRDRWTEGERDREIWQLLDLRAGEEDRDPLSVRLSARAIADLDGKLGGTGSPYGSLADTFDSSVTALLYEAYAAFRPESGPVEGVRVGRQYVLSSESFHLDGVSATSRPGPGRAGVQWSAFGGVPVHPYEKSPSGDWLAGAGVSGEPWEGGRAALEWVHVQDRLSLLGAEGVERDDLATLSLWQSAGAGFDLHGRFSWLDGPRDAAFRASWTRPEDAVLVLATYERLLERARQSTTETDPYTAVLADLERYEAGSLLATVGIGPNVDVEAGASARRLLPGVEESKYNRDTTRVYLGPALTDLPWTGLTTSLFGEAWSGGGGKIRTLSGELAQRFDGGIRASLGTDYTLFALGPFGGDERMHVRTVYARVRAPLSRRLSVDLQYSWEKDDQERFHAISLAFQLAF